MTPNVINIKTQSVSTLARADMSHTGRNHHEGPSEMASPSPVKKEREYSELNPDFFSLRPSTRDSPRNLKMQREHKASYAAEDF